MENNGAWVSELMQNAFHSDDPGLAAFVAEHCVPERMKKGTVLSGENIPLSHYYIQMDGVICSTATKQNGGRQILVILTDKYTATGPNVEGSINVATDIGKRFGARNREGLMALTDVTVAGIAAEKLSEAMYRFPPVTMFIISAALKMTENLGEVIRMLHMPAMRRYEWFLERFPGLLDEISYTAVADFLNMTPVSLSRLRAARGETGARQSKIKKL